ARTARFDPLLALDHLKSLPIYEGQAVHTETFPGREGEYAETAHPLHPEVTVALAASKGVTRLFKHQALAIDAAVAGQHVALSTATSSGKSVVFNVSVIEAILGPRPAAVALYLFPTKALAQDQLRSLKGLIGASAYLSQCVRPMTLDGDTPFRERGVVTEEANIILTNPDMLHASVLPGHKRFRRILGNLSHVVIDEVRRRPRRAEGGAGAGGGGGGCASGTSPEGGAVDANAKTPPRAARMVSSAEKVSSKAGAAEEGGSGSTRHRPADSGDAPRRKPGGDEPANRSEGAPATARLTRHATRGSPDASFGGVGVGAARSGDMGDLQAEELDSNAVALEKASMKGFTEVATLAEAGAGDGAVGGVTATGPTKEGGSAGGEDLEGQGEDEPGWEDGRRRSPICETAQILAALVKQRVRTLAFCRTRKLTELTLRYGLQDLEKTAPHMVSLVQGYRGGYTKDERRKIEGRLFANELLGVTATCALELGVDIGELDVTLHLGFPGSVSSLRQQAGRAGRGGTDSLAIMVIFQDPISQFFVRNPRELFHKEPEAAVLDSTNELVLRAHVLCAAAECPLGVPSLGDVTDAALFGGGERLQEVIHMLTGGDFPRLVRATGNLGWKANPGLDPPPCRRVGLRMIDPVSFSVVDDLKGGEPYDTVEYSRAFFSLFEGAIYLHQARQYMVTRLDLARHVAHTIPVKVNYYTAARNNVDVNVTKRLEVSEDNHAHTGCVDIICTVYGFVKKQLGTGRTIERGECTLPPLQYATRAFWLDVGVTAKRKVEGEGCDFEGGVHAVGHALLAVVPLFLLCDAEDVDCEHARPHHNRPQPQRILVFDKRPGGVGVSDAMFGCHRAVMTKALELVEGCPCPDGCLACIHDHGCTGYNSASTALRVDTQQEEGGDGNTGGGEPDEELIASPRKRQRLRNLRLAKGMERARENDIAVVRRWIPSVP
ncbi:unnamed protein product, partial [Laminaria digitata]